MTGWLGALTPILDESCKVCRDHFSGNCENCHAGREMAGLIIQATPNGSAAQAECRILSRLRGIQLRHIVEQMLGEEARRRNEEIERLFYFLESGE